MFDTTRIRGVIPAMVTPMTADGAPDEAGIRSHVRFLLGAGVDGLFTLGSSGEFSHLTLDDRRLVVATIVDEVAGRVPVVAGASESGTRQVLQMIEIAALAGADAVVVLPTYYMVPTEADVIRHYEIVLDRSPLPVVLYNNPASTRTTLSVNLVRDLAEHPNTAGIKDSSGDFASFRRLLQLFRGQSRFRVIQGHEGHVALSFHLGGHAGQLGLANIVPSLFVDLFAAATEGRLEDALLLQSKVDALSAIWSAAGDTEASYLGSMKAALEMLGVCGPDLAPPFARLDNDSRGWVRAILEQHSVLAPAPESSTSATTNGGNGLGPVVSH
jgi:dihydrodipicolinate synthase/N-acetylneuraminate lyase